MLIHEQVEAISSDMARATVGYSFSEREVNILKRFCTNVDKKVFLIHSLPQVVISSLLAMYSRIKNVRGIRGHFVDSLMPLILLDMADHPQFRVKGGDPEVLAKVVRGMESYIKDNKLKTLDAFCDFHPKHQKMYERFLREFNVNPELVERVCSSPKFRWFNYLFLDKYGHNSIARTSHLIIGIEGVSILTAKSVEWSRAAFGAIELSTRFVDVSRAELYRIWEILKVYSPQLAVKVKSSLERSFERYCQRMNGLADSSFANFLRQRYKGVVDDKEMEGAVFGELCDVYGNLLPSATLTSLGVSVSGEELPEMIKHMILDSTPENIALANLIMEEADKLGGGQFLRHMKISPWIQTAWNYLSISSFKDSPSGISSLFSWVGPSDEDARKVIQGAFEMTEGFENSHDLFQSIALLNTMDNIRDPFDKLPNHFEFVGGVFHGIMSFRGWRDIQRHTLSTHFRTLVTPLLGVYKYDKPAPADVQSDIDELYAANLELYRDFEWSKVVGREYLAQYPMIMANRVGFLLGNNLRQWEFISFQRTKHGVNHEVRQVVLSGENLLRKKYPWWERISTRADMVPAYLFARTKEGVALEAAEAAVSLSQPSILKLK